MTNKVNGNDLRVVRRARIISKAENELFLSALMMSSENNYPRKYTNNWRRLHHLPMIRRCKL